MKLCLNTSTIRPQPLLDKIRIASAAGYDGVELWINDIYEHVGRGGEVREIEQSLVDQGLEVPCTIALRGWGGGSGAGISTHAGRSTPSDGNGNAHRCTLDRRHPAA